MCRLRRSLYGFKQTPCAWYTCMDSYISGLGFTESEADANLYYILIDDRMLILVLYVDDLILTIHERLIQSWQEDLSREFEMKDMCLRHYYLGLEVWQEDGTYQLG